jgi:hypothetical protein
MGDWHDYVSLLPTMAAVINGFIAVVIAQFLQDRRRAKVVLVAFAGLVGLIAISATLYGQHAIMMARSAERARYVDIREHVGEFISQGNDLMRECGNNNAPPPIQTANEWAGRTEEFLAEQLGKSYVTRFRDGTGAPSMSLNGADAIHQNVWFGIYIRVLRLERFSGELLH